MPIDINLLRNLHAQDKSDNERIVAIRKMVENKEITEKQSYKLFRGLTTQRSKKYLTDNIKKIKYSNNYFMDGRILSENDIKLTLKILPKDLREWFLNAYGEFVEIVIETDVEHIKPDQVNLFKGFKYSKISKDVSADGNDLREVNHYTSKEMRDINFILNDYMKSVLCSGDDEIFQYVLNWTASVCQGKKNKSCLVMKGNEGVGKSSYYEMMLGLLGIEIWL